MTTVTAPAWAPWTSYYDSTGQGPAMVTSVAADGLNVRFGLDRFILSLQGGQDAPFAGAAVLSGALSVDVPPDFDLVGFLLLANGALDKTPGRGDLLDRARHAIPAVAARHHRGRPFRVTG
jgi:hypothetical protein